MAKGEALPKPTGLYRRAISSKGFSLLPLAFRP
jgi:hypothetical protein